MVEHIALLAFFVVGLPLLIRVMTDALPGIIEQRLSDKVLAEAERALNPRPYAHRPGFIAGATAVGSVATTALVSVVSLPSALWGGAVVLALGTAWWVRVVERKLMPTDADFDMALRLLIEQAND